MSRAELTDIFNLLHEALSHVPYAICGLTALIDHGFTRRQANRVSILCPQESKNNIKAWAAARGYPTTADSLGLPSHDGSLRRVRIKYIDTGFERLQRVRSRLSNATVLSPMSQLDNVAAGYLENRRRGDTRAVETVSKDLFWCLGYITTHRVRPNPRLLPTFLGEEFFADFTASYPEARPAIALAGIDVAAVLAHHNTAAILREHDEMLRSYGMAGDVLPSYPGQFERMGGLMHSQSIYTLREAAGTVSPAPWSRP
ncbi:hypothetical protein F4861DRAFT_437671 [Xylaria intraflava]|nr:hypothetical protein F4861DRAFT_437671 [Xylaria intraflava]